MPNLAPKKIIKKIKFIKTENAKYFALNIYSVSCHGKCVVRLKCELLYESLSCDFQSFIKEIPPFSSLVHVLTCDCVIKCAWGKGTSLL